MYTFLPEGLCQKEQTNQEIFFDTQYLHNSDYCCDPQVTQFVYLLEKYAGYQYDSLFLLHSWQSFWFFFLLYGFGLIHNKEALCKIWIDFAFQILMTFSESLIQHY